jgi:peroxiredoxin Q/BCP
VGSDELQAFDVAFFEASVDTPDMNARLAELLDLPHPILSDPDRRVAASYGLLAGGRRTAARWTFYIGIDGRILYIDRAVIADGHGEEVPARLDALGIPRRASRPVPQEPLPRADAGLSGR